MERPLDSWEMKPGKACLTASGWYRCWLFGEGKEVEKSAYTKGRRGMAKEKVQKVMEQGGKLSLGELLRCRVRYFSDGVAIGSRSYVDGVFSEWRGQFGEKRKDGARTLHESDTGLFSLRALRVHAVE